jgi:serine/threonine-protein kinase
VKATQDQHPCPEKLSAFALGRLAPPEQAEIESHVAECEVCCRRLSVVPDDSLIDRLRDGNTVAAIHQETSQPTAPTVKDAVPNCPPALADHPRYKIVRFLGGGGMGAVYQAEHRIMERPVALKVVRADLLGNAGAVERFRQEVKTAARLAHPNIVTAHDADQAGDVHFLVMELVDGISLARLIEKKGPLPIANACAYIRQAAIGLQHAHEKGMVHRDIKPHNLMLTRQGTVKILDFGLARFASERSEDGADGKPTDMKTALTQYGVVLGTPDFVAPEQARDSRKADIRADIYSLGCTLFFLLTGKPPFAGGSALEKLVHHFEALPPKVNESRTDVPADLAALVARMLAKDPDERFQTPAEVAQALLPWTKPVAARAPEPASAVAPLPAVSAVKASTPAMPRSVLPRPAPPPEPEAKKATEAAPLAKPRRKRRKRSQYAWLVPSAIVLFLLGTITLAAVATRPFWGPLFASPLPRDRDLERSPGGAKPRIDPAAGKPHTGAGHRPTILLALPQKGFWYPDYGPVRQVLEEHGFRVLTAAPRREEAYPAGDGPRDGKPFGEGPFKKPGKPPPPPPEGFRRHEAVHPDLALKEVCAEDFEAVVFVGGPGVRDLIENPENNREIHRIVDDMQSKGRWVAALCAGVNILAETGVLLGKHATGNEFLDDRFKKSADWQWDRSVIIHDRIITGRDERAADEFARELAHQLKGR